MAAAGSGEQQTPYIGSKISLISKSEIRYEGILYTVDTKESTIALAQVKSFGTEDRATDQPFPARDEVFRFIIFKASDIKDLMVCETPKPVPQMVPGLTYDPAIVSVSQSIDLLHLHKDFKDNMKSPKCQPGGAAGGTGASPGGRGVPPSGSSSRTGTPNQQQVQSPDQQYGGRGRRSPGAQQSRQFSGRQYNNQNHNQYNNNGRQPPHAYGARGAPGAPMSYRNAAMSGVRGRGGASGPGPIGAPVNMAHQGAANAMMNQGYGRGGPMNHYHRGQFHQRHPQGGNHYRGRGRGGPGAPHEKLKFDTEFDFEKSNELFQETRGELEKELKTKLKLNESGENSDVEEGEKDVTEKDAANSENAGEEVEGDEDDSQFYDKAVSFFDNISCEALEKQEGQHRRNDWKKERETNTETFGTAALRSYNFRRGGYHRGYNRGYNNYRGGGGYYRGGRGGYHNNYRHNNNFQVANY